MKSALFDHNSEIPFIIKPDGIFTSPPSEKVGQLSEKFDQAFKIIKQQQLFLKSLDSKARKKHLVITGLTKENDITGSRDVGKVRNAIEATGFQLISVD